MTVCVCVGVCTGGYNSSFKCSYLTQITTDCAHFSRGVSGAVSDILFIFQYSLRICVRMTHTRNNVGIVASFKK